MLRITAVGAGAVDYLLRGSGCEHAKERAQEAPELDADKDPDAARYFADAIEHGEPAGRWLGSGMEGLGLDARPGDVAVDDDVRAVFGQLRRPESSEADPAWIGSKPRRYRDTAERLAELVAKEPGASEERLRELEVQAAGSGRRPVAYYDWTFSPAKSVSVYYASLLAAGLTKQAQAVREAHDEAVRIAIGYAEKHAAYVRRGDHGINAEGARVGDFAQATGLTVLTFSHSTSREAEPQLHTHAAVLNRGGTEDGHIGALDGRGFRPIKEAVATAYERALEQLLNEELGLAFAERPDGLAREIVGVDPELCTEASTRRGQVTAKVDELMAAYRERHDAEPDAAARKAMAQAATLSTRQPKSGLAGPAAVAAWAERRRDWCEEVLDQVDAAALAAARVAAADTPAMAAPMADVRLRDRDDRAVEGPATVTGPTVDRAAQQQAWLDKAVAAGVADIQTRYATWTLGNLVDAIDNHLGDAGALGVAAADRAQFLEDLARAALAPDGGHGVVQLTGHEPVAVPDALRRTGPGEDGRPRFRPHMDERYATTAHLAAEERLVALAQAERGARIDDPQLDARLAAQGLSDDQRAAVVGIAGSGRGGDVLIGPAGAGKSRTVGALSSEWGTATGGRVFGVATSQNATANLACDGLEALNVTKFLGQFGIGDDGAPPRDLLGPDDLVMVDEASMSATADLERIATIAADAGAKVVYTGDHHQLDAVGAGGMFAHLAESLDAGQRHELVEVHRFREEWERDASLGLRGADHAAIPEYADRGRLHTGSLEEMEDQASRAYLADTLSGRGSLLVVGTNDHAVKLSARVREDLIELGRVAAEPLGVLTGGQEVSAGDRIQARRNDYTLRVDPAVDDHGRPGLARPVTNRAMYTVLAVDDRGDLLARDEDGAVARLPEDYVREHVALGYATTVHGAQGLTVDTAHPLLDRDATREHAYVGSTRGREANHLWLVTAREPDEHDQQRVTEQAAERLAAVLDNRSAQDAATGTRAAAETDLESLAAVVARWDVETARAARERHYDVLAARLSEPDAARLQDDPGHDRLLRALREADLAGHDTTELLGEVTEGSLTTAESVADVLRARVRIAQGRRTPERDVDPADWNTLSAAATGDDETSRYIGEAATLASARQALLGERVAEQPPAWALEALGEVPDAAEADQRAAWQRRAGINAAYRELAGIPDEQRSLGEPPSRERELHRALWRGALDALGCDQQDGERDLREADDAELYGLRERWTRELDAAPPWVAEQLADTHELAREYAADAAFGRARLGRLDPADPQAQELAERVERSEWFAEQHAADAAELEAAHQHRSAWWQGQTANREADAAAADELARRGLQPQRGPEFVEEPTVEDESTEPGSSPLPQPALEPTPDREPGATEKERVADGPGTAELTYRDPETGDTDREIARLWLESEGADLYRIERDRLAALEDHVATQRSAERADEERRAREEDEREPTSAERDYRNPDASETTREIARVWLEQQGADMQREEERRLAALEERTRVDRGAEESRPANPESAVTEPESRTELDDASDTDQPPVEPAAELDREDPPAHEPAEEPARFAEDNQAAARADLDAVARERRVADERRVEAAAEQAQRARDADRQHEVEQAATAARERDAAAEAAAAEAAVREPESEPAAPEPQVDDEEPDA
ncbi:MobF family relaxase [Actinomycetospora flava]|uniref:MobF family relaxase n=1 Tax=Actinomycetospora flava TaxID=3129232 RepID=A0ABU8MG96_9PSEU